MRFFVIFTISILTVLGQHSESDCRAQLDLGKSKCSGKKAEIKYHYDAKTATCLAFLYTGCGGNANRFDSDSECYRTCQGIDALNCPLGSKPLPKTNICQDSKECGSKGYCNMGSGFGICCEKKWQEKLDKEYGPKCPAGKKAYEPTDGGIASLRLGKSCKSNHCPEKATCVQGEFFAACCV
ncbi:unnamed protein product [Caenorhabditis angaria]|uniref:BPTI/Kunitz inhibitor domain-containing protein n=1 Tax=Caenorhabditis angaria TaxID=860376 RepID=A0A9P1MYY8_9PELO|nr:unnamed protein product [Caenorhabditis angaria]